MCSVPGLPDIGSNITLHVTRVNLNPHSVLVEFGGNLNHRPGTKEVHRQIKKEIDVESESQDNFEGKPGDVCYVYDDKYWHRARILSKYEHEYNVFLIDEGKLFWASKKVLAKCPPNLFSLPPTVELCILAGALPLCVESGWSEAASEFIRCLNGKNISGRVQDVMPYRILLLDIPSISNQMYELGFTRKTSDEDLKGLVKTLLHSPKGIISIRTDFAMPNAQEHNSESEMLYQYLYPELLPGTIEIVTVTQVVHPLKIFCKLHVFSQELKKLSDVLHKCHEDAIPSLMSQPLSDGSPCATKGSDGKWYRSVLQQKTVSDVIKVFHVDYGIGDFVKLCNVRPLSARFLQLPVVTYACSLHGIVDKGTGWRTDQIDFLKSIVQDQIFIGKFEQRSLHEGVYHVTLYGSDNVNVNNVFGLKEHCLSVAERKCADKTLEALNKVTYRHQHDNVPACSQSPNTSFSTDTREDFSAGSKTEAHLVPTEGMQSLNNAFDVSLPKTEVGIKKKVWITCVRSVNQFYGHFAQNIDAIKKMTRDIQQLCRKRTQAKCSLSPKMMCFAKYTDGCWHRGQIESTHPKLLVHFVDYGNVLALDKSEILPLTPEASAVASIPVYTVEFELFNVTLPESDELNEWFENYATDVMFCVTVMKQNPLGKLSVEMYDEKTNLNLKMKGKLSKSKKLKQGSNINREADKAHACKVFSEVIESKRQRDQFSTTQANEMMYRKVPKPVVQGILEQDCNTTGRRRAGCNDSLQQMAKQPKVMSHYPKLTDLPSRDLNEGYVSEVYLSHCNSPSSFYVQLTSEEDKTFSLLDELNSSQLSSAQVDLHVLRPGDIVQAEYPSDGAWYRAVVQNKQDGKVQVQFIDFGNEVTIPPFKVRQLDKRFLNMPRLSIHCSLEDGKTGYKRDWTKEQVIAFKKAAGENGEKKILCKFILNNKNSAWLVSLEHQGVMLEGPSFNVSQTDLQMPGTKDIQLVTYKEPALTERQTVEAYASSICGPNYFWCQFKNSEELDKISLIAQEIGNGTQTKPIQQDQLREGLPCLARFSDELWYRAQVITKLSNTLSVLFIDYGNESEIDLNSVKSLSCKLLERPPQAFLCQLGGFGSTHDTWNDVASDTFFELLVDEPLKVTIQNTVMTSGFSKCPQYNVLVECKGLVVNDFMKDYWCGPKPQICSQVSEGTKGNPLAGQNKHAVASPKTVQKDLINDSVNPKLVQHLPQATDLPPRVIETGMVCEVYISHISSRSSFFVQLAEDEDTLFSLSEQLNSPQLSVKDVIHASNVKQGSLVKAVFPEDDCWYRAVVKGMTESGMIQVEFIDFGNEAIVSPSNICRLDELLLSYPRFSIHCSSHFEAQLKMQKGLEKEMSLFKNVFGQVGENRLSCKFIKEDKATWEVKMALKGSTLDSLLDKSEKWDDSNQNREKIHSAKQMVAQAEVSIPVNPQFKKPDVSLGQTVEAFASCIVGPNYFWCQFANSEQLDQISHIAQEYGNSNETQPIQMDHLGPGNPCLARFSEDLMWYRAQVIKKCNDTISVLFVDYGNESEIDERSVKALPFHLLDTPPQAFLCLLEGFAHSEGFWDDTAADHFHELLVDKPLKVTVNAIENTVDPNSLPYCVKIEMQQCLVNELMRNFWSASVRRDQNSAEVFISCENSVESGELCVSEDNQTSETHCVPLPESGEVEELSADVVLHGRPESKVDDKLDKTDITATVTNCNATDNSLTSTDSLLENNDQIHESDDRVPVVSVQETLLDTVDSRKETEDERSDKDALATLSKSKTWTAGLETLPMVCNEEFCEPTECISK